MKFVQKQAEKLKQEPLTEKNLKVRPNDICLLPWNLACIAEHHIPGPQAIVISSKPFSSYDEREQLI